MRQKLGGVCEGRRGGSHLAASPVHDSRMTDLASGIPAPEPDPSPDADPAPGSGLAPVRRTRRRRVARRIVIGLIAAIGAVSLLVSTAGIALAMANNGTPSAAAQGTGHDALWLGHAWVDGRKGQSDVDSLATRLRSTGIHDLFVHVGPFNNDGTLDPALRPQARWLIQALHSALPGVRIQAWLGAHPTPEEFQLNSAASRAAVVSSVAQVLDDGFDGVHLDFEPLADGDEDLLSLLRDTHLLTARRGVVLSVSAVRGEPASGVAVCLTALPGRLAIWSGGYLHRVALEVDQVAIMAYDSGLPTRATYGGYVRRSTEIALEAVPASVTLFIGVPAYYDDTLYHHPSVEVIPVALRAVRLAMGSNPVDREFGVAIYVDFTATAEDWASYHDGWTHITT
jgi:hypothetical protein